jgi:hypothetical protein
MKEFSIYRHAQISQRRHPVARIAKCNRVSALIDGAGTLVDIGGVASKSLHSKRAAHLRELVAGGRVVDYEAIQGDVKRAIFELHGGKIDKLTAKYLGVTSKNTAFRLLSPDELLSGLVMSKKDRFAKIKTKKHKDK